MDYNIGPCDQTEDGTVHPTVSVYPSPPKGHQAATEGAGEALPGPHQTGERPERAQGKPEENQGWVSENLSTAGSCGEL